MKSTILWAFSRNCSASIAFNPPSLIRFRIQQPKENQELIRTSISETYHHSIAKAVTRFYQHKCIYTYLYLRPTRNQETTKNGYVRNITHTTISVKKHWASGFCLHKCIYLYKTYMFCRMFPSHWNLYSGFGGDDNMTEGMTIFSPPKQTWGGGSVSEWILAKGFFCFYLLEGWEKYLGHVFALSWSESLLIIVVPDQ